MSRLEDTPFEALFLDGSKGRLFGLYFSAIGKTRGQVLCIPPFTEESNRCRVMLGMGARALAHQGYATLVLDLSGTGNSDGEFGDAGWSDWLDDISTGIDWLSNKGSELTLWGTRLAALLVVDAARTQPERISRLMFWQPVANGKLMFTQYLRLRVANSLETGGKQETTATLRALLAEGEALEVGGYCISSQLAADLDRAAMPTVLDLPDIQVDWLEAVDEGKSELSIASMKIINGWLEQGIRVNLFPFKGPQFWQLHERFLAPDLVEKTLQVFANE
mgnify:CR=1 FL=1